MPFQSSSPPLSGIEIHPMFFFSPSKDSMSDYDLLASGYPGVGEQGSPDFTFGNIADDTFNGLHSLADSTYPMSTMSLNVPTWPTQSYNYSPQYQASYGQIPLLLSPISAYSAHSAPLTPRSAFAQSPSLSPASATSMLTPLTPASLQLAPAPTPSPLIIPHEVPLDEHGNDQPAQGLTFKQVADMFMRDFKLSALGTGPFIPQQLYTPHTASDRKRYVEDTTLRDPIYFNNRQGTCGIALSDALKNPANLLQERDVPVFEGLGPSVSIRIEWPGYSSWTVQIPTKDFRNPPQPITVGKLAKGVARSFEKFLKSRKELVLERPGDSQWRFFKDGLPGLRIEDLVLVSIYHVSLGSWQPHFKLRTPQAVAQTMPSVPRGIAPPRPVPISNMASNARFAPYARRPQQPQSSQRCFPYHQQQQMLPPPQHSDTQSPYYQPY